MEIKGIQNQGYPKYIWGIPDYDRISTSAPQNVAEKQKGTKFSVKQANTTLMLSVETVSLYTPIMVCYGHNL